MNLLMSSLSFAFFGKCLRFLKNTKKIKRLLSLSLQRPYLCFRIIPSVEHIDVIKSLQPDLVLDVGFNRGQFTALCSILYPKTRILAFDPLKYSIYSKVNFMRSYLGSYFDFLNCALSDRNTFAAMKESYSLDSSSLLTPSDYNLARYPSVSSKGISYHVIEATLSELVDISFANQSLLKLDVQGYEYNVLKGVSDLQFNSIKWIYLELSDIEMYSGQKTRKDIHQLLLSKDYALTETTNIYRDAQNKIIYCDCLYTRNNPT